MNAPASITITPVRVADLLAEGERMPVNVHVIDHPEARVLVDTGMTELHQAPHDRRPAAGARARPRAGLARARARAVATPHRLGHHAGAPWALQLRPVPRTGGRRRPIGRIYDGPMASVKQIQVTFDCAEPERVARFWCEVLGYVVPPPPEGFATWDDFDRSLRPEHQGSAFACIDPSGVGPRLFFQRVPEGKVVKNRLHLDVRVGTGLVGEERLAVLEAECARLVALGAARVRLLLADGDEESCLVMQDIEGNEFCLD